MKLKFSIIFQLFLTLSLLSSIICQRSIVTERTELSEGVTETPDHVENLEQDFDPQKYFENFGYDHGDEADKIPVNTDKQKFYSIVEDDQKNRIILFQTLNNLNATGILDEETQRKMRQPRCGVPDIKKNKSKFYDYNTKSSWSKTDLTYRFARYTPDLGETRTRIAIKEAFQYWADVTPLTFTEVSSQSQSDLLIDFGRRSHGYTSRCPYPFDGQGGTLAHAYFPEDGRIDFDEDEYFTEGTSNGINLRIVAAHEIGHALGLDHSFTEGSLMFAYYQYVENFKLHYDDILGIQSLYGPSNKRKTTTTTTKTTQKPTTTTTTKTTQKPTTTQTTTKFTTKTTTKTINSTTQEKKNLEPCTDLYEALFLGPKNSLYAITKQENLWKYSFDTDEWKLDNLFSVLPKIERNVRGGVMCNKNYIWFFKERKVWAYKDNKLVSGFPTRISDPLFPSNPYAAVNKKGVIYLLKGYFAYKFNTTSLSIIGKPLLASYEFNGVQSWIEAAITINKELYMFKDTYFYKFDESFRLLPSYPKLKENAWFACSNEKFTTSKTPATTTTTKPTTQTTKSAGKTTSFDTLEYYKKLCSDALMYNLDPFICEQYIKLWKHRMLNQ